MCRHYRRCEVLQTQVFFFCNSCRGLERPLGFPGGCGSQILRQSAHEGDQVVSPMHQLPLPQGDIPGNHFCYMLSLLQGQNVAGRITSMKTSDGTIGNRTCDLPACSSVPPPTVPPHAPQRHIIQFTFASTYYNMNICDTQKFSTRSELHNSKQRTHDVSPEKVHKLNSSSLLSNTVQLQPPCILYIHDGCPASPPTNHGILHI